MAWREFFVSKVVVPILKTPRGSTRWAISMVSGYIPEFQNTRFKMATCMKVGEFARKQLEKQGWTQGKHLK